MTDKYNMKYRLYTTVDITHTGQYKYEYGREQLQWKEQNFNTVLQTLGLRANISYDTDPVLLYANGDLIGFNTNKVIRIWQFDFYTSTDDVYETDSDPIKLLLDDFELVPFISGLDESMTQNYDVFVTIGPSRNIIFIKKQ